MEWILWFEHVVSVAVLRSHGNKPIPASPTITNWARREVFRCKMLDVTRDEKLVEKDQLSRRRTPYNGDNTDAWVWIQ